MEHQLICERTRHQVIFRPGRGAFALPTLLMITTILLLIAGAIGQLGFTNLHTSHQDHDANEALFAAEAGLVAAADELSQNGKVDPKLEAELPNGAKYRVQSFINDKTLPMDTVHGVKIPPGTIYLHSLGTSRDGRTKESGLLLKKGHGFFRVGALGRTFDMANSDFDAFSSDQADYPSSVVNDAMIAASNSDSGTVFDLTGTAVQGGIFVGAGGDAGTSIVADGSSSVARQGSLTQPLEVDKVVIPDLSDGDGDGSTGDDDGDHSITFPNVSDFRVEKVGDELRLTYEESGSTQFQMIIQDDGAFTIENESVFGHHESAIGNLQEGWGTITQSSGDDSPPQIIVLDDNAFMYNSRDVGRAVALSPDGTLHFTQGDTTDTLPLPGWAFGADGPPSVENPDVLTGGEYDTVTINAGQTELESGETFVVDSLEITSGGALALPEDAESVNIYVRNSLILDGDDALLNDTRKAPKLNIFYLGEDDVQLRGGSMAYFTLFAPDADLVLSGTESSKTDFYGALVGKTIEVSHANFHFDLATMGIGKGTSGEHLEILARPRY
jgi:hypothetical protein